MTIFHLGGLDYDEALARYAERHLQEQEDRATGALTPAVRRQIRREAERAKRALGVREHASLLLQDLELDDRGLRDLEIPIDRAGFRALTAGLNAEVAETVRRAIKGFQAKTGGGVKQIERVLLAGQGSKIFTVREALDSLGLKVQVVSQFQETAVVHGLAYQSGVLQGTTKDILLLDVAHGGLGVRCRPSPELDQLLVRHRHLGRLAAGTRGGRLPVGARGDREHRGVPAPATGHDDPDRPPVHPDRRGEREPAGRAPARRVPRRRRSRPRADRRDPV